MARSKAKARRTRPEDASSDDDSPEVVSRSTSKADAKRNQRALRDFEVEEKARRRARNREKDQKLKERALATKGGKSKKEPKGVRFVDQDGEGEDEEGSGGGGGGDELEARMLRAMRDAADEAESGEDEEFRETSLDDEGASGSDFSFARVEDGDDDAMSTQENDEVLTDDNENENTTRKLGYLPDDLFATAFAAQSSKEPVPKKNTESAQQRKIKKRRRKSTSRPKDVVLGGRTIRTLPPLSDPRSQATARTVPSAGARKFFEQSLAMRGMQSLLKAKKKGWERRPANVGVMKYQGPPHGFVRSAR